MTEREICEWMANRVAEGRKRFDTGEACPYAANTVAAFLDIQGWCYQDQRRAHMRLNPRYRAEQESIFGAGA